MKKIKLGSKAWGKEKKIVIVEEPKVEAPKASKKAKKKNEESE